MIEILPASGEYIWLANRANFSYMRLTREFDLSGVFSATLNYQVFYQIEQGYDFAYVSVSTDNDRTWHSLVSENLLRSNLETNPDDKAFTDYFYSGQSMGWIAETADLTPYAGMTIQIRFEYVTDPILTYDGLAIDNISIPEIGFYDDVEKNMHWNDEGFIRATGYIPQHWDLQLITFENNMPVVERLMLNDNQTLALQLSRVGQSTKRPILIVAAAAPISLQPAYYQLVINR